MVLRVTFRRHSDLPHCTTALNNRSSEQSSFGSFTIVTIRDGDNDVNPTTPLHISRLAFLSIIPNQTRVKRVEGRKRIHQ
jgi:hypothetical protein